MSGSLRDQVFRVIVCAAHDLKKLKTEAVFQGHARVVPTRFPLRRRTDIFHSPARSSEGLSTRAGMAQPLPRPSFFYVQCPKCSTQRNVVHTKLYGTRGWTCLLCAHCGRTSSARLWNCTCGKVWCSCPIHHPHGYACIGSPSARQRCSKRPSFTTRGGSLLGTLRKQRTRRIAHSRQCRRRRL